MYKTRLDPKITWPDFKGSFISFVNHFKVLKIKEERELIYRGGSLTKFVTEKYERLNEVYPELSELLKIRTIVASFNDDELIKEFSKLISNNLNQFMINVYLYDKQKYPVDSSKNIIHYNITDYYTPNRNCVKWGQTNWNIGDQTFGTYKMSRTALPVNRSVSNVAQYNRPQDVNPMADRSNDNLNQSPGLFRHQSTIFK